MHATRLTWYYVRLVIYLALSLVHFVSKPGSRIVVPLAIAGFAFLQRAAMHQELVHQVQGLDAGYRPESGLLDVATVIVVVLASIAYMIVSRILAATLGAFPVPLRPLKPFAKLKPTTTEITVAPVRIVVPPLPRAAG